MKFIADSSGSLAGRIVFAAAIIGFGVVGLVFGKFLNSLQPVPEALPGYRPLAIVNGLLLLTAGLALIANFKVRPAAITVAIMLGLGILVLHVPSAFIEPGLLRSPWWIRTFESLAIAGAALILAGQASAPVREQWIRIGRILFGVSLPVFGILHFIYPESVAGLVALSPVAYPWPMFWAFLTGAGHFAAGVAIASGVLSRLAAVLAGIMYASWALTLHLPRIIDHPETYSGNRQELTSTLVCFVFWGAAWIVAGSVAKASSNPAVERQGSSGVAPLVTPDHP